jgi:Prokaryotic RING finger family 1
MVSIPIPTIHCPYCLHPIVSDEPTLTCPTCQTSHHLECWDELGGCAMYGCARMVEVHKADDDVVTSWGARDKDCPMCAEKIPVIALACPYCRTRFADTRPMHREELLRKVEDPVVSRNRRWAIFLLILSLLGVTSPLALALGLVRYVRHKMEIEQAGPMVRGTILIALGISAAYLLFMSFGLGVYAVLEELNP